MGKKREAFQRMRASLAEIIGEITAVRHQLHEYPELSLEEHQTLALIEGMVQERVAYERCFRVGETGLFVEVQGLAGPSERAIGFRGDLDALPIQEAEGMALRSKIPGVMHACGHDVHASITLAGCLLASSLRPYFAGRVCFFFQPAEEVLLGAKMFLADPRIDMSAIDTMIGLHVSPELEAGTIGIKYGSILASADKLSLTIEGRGGHGAHPHTVLDPMLMAASLIMNLQSVVSRKVSPADSAVLSLCKIQGGTAHNIVPNSIAIEGTVRALKPEVRDMVEAEVHRIAKATGEAFGGRITLAYERGVPALENSPEFVDRVRAMGTKLWGPEGVVLMEAASMGGDDFAFLKEGKKGGFIRLGARSQNGPYGSIHSDRFYCDDLAIRIGSECIMGLILEELGQA